MPRDPALGGIRDALPSRGEVFFWAGGLTPPAGAGAPAGTEARSAGGRISAGTTLEIELAAEPPASPRGGDSGGPAELPARLAAVDAAPVR